MVFELEGGKALLDIQDVAEGMFLISTLQDSAVLSCKHLWGEEMLPQTAKACCKHQYLNTQAF